MAKSVWLHTLGDKRVNLGFEFWPWHLLGRIGLGLDKRTSPLKRTDAGLCVVELEIGARQYHAEFPARDPEMRDMQSWDGGEANPVLRRGAHIAIGVPKGDALLVEVDLCPERWVVRAPLADAGMV
jgi:hypothetical protein